MNMDDLGVSPMTSETPNFFASITSWTSVFLQLFAILFQESFPMFSQSIYTP